MRGAYLSSFLLFALAKLLATFAQTVNSSMETSVAVVTTMSGLSEEEERSAGRVASGDSEANHPCRSANILLSFSRFSHLGPESSARSHVSRLP